MIQANPSEQNYRHIMKVEEEKWKRVPSSGANPDECSYVLLGLLLNGHRSLYDPHIIMLSWSL